VLLRDDVIDPARSERHRLGNEAYSHRSPARSRTKRLKAAGT
jgi:hypothetical protein